MIKGNEMSRELHCIWVSRKADNELYFGIDAYNEDEKKVFCAEPPTFKERQLFDTDDDRGSMCVITDDMAERLMDFLWKAGIRPTENS